MKDTILSYIDMSDWKVKENSNMQYSLQGLNNHIHQQAIKDFWLEDIYGQKNRNIPFYHNSGLFHIHDLGCLSSYCVGWDLHDLLQRGFGGVENKISCGPAKHFRTALGQMVNFLYTMQGEVAGAVAFSNFDTLLAPFIYYDRLSYETVKQNMQEFVFNMNVPTRVGFQSPFSNITFDLAVPPNFADMKAIIGGIEKELTYKHFQKEMDMINTAFVEVMSNGDFEQRPFSFPIPTYNITKEFNWNSPVAEKILELTAKYGTPYFANYISSDISPQDVRSMCCRLRLDNTVVMNHIGKLSQSFNILNKSYENDTSIRRGGLFSSNPLTGSIGVVTINIPRIAMMSHNDFKKFYTLLKDAMNTAKESLEIKRRYIEELTVSGMFPYCRVYLDKIYSLSGQYWANHFSTIGLVGMHEGLLNMGISDGILSRDGTEKALEIMDFMLVTLKEFTEETNNLYNLEASPAEGTSYRLACIDKKEYGNSAFFSGTDETPYYTNSVHPPVNSFIDPFDLLEHQKDLQTRWTGGTVVHIFVGEKISSANVLKDFIKKAFTNYRLPYMSITPTFSICPVHGYISGEKFTCPICSMETEVYSRIVGYYRPVKVWNAGKKQEYLHRVQFSLRSDSKCLQE